MDKILNLFNGIALAADSGSSATGTEIDLSPGSQFSNLGGLSLPEVVSAIITLVLVIAALIAFFFLIYGGIKWITSGGDKEQTAAAQSTLTAAIIGLAIVFSTWAIMNLLGSFFGIDILKSGGKGITIPEVGK